jgi:hypothetical protein
MRENRLYGSEGGEVKAFPTPIIFPLVPLHRGFDRFQGGLPRTPCLPVRLCAEGRFRPIAAIRD